MNTQPREIICGDIAAECVCTLPPKHDPPHHCQRDNCDGQWVGAYNGDDFDIVRFPRRPGDPRLSALLDFVAAGIAAQEAVQRAIEASEEGREGDTP